MERNEVASRIVEVMLETFDLDGLDYRDDLNAAVVPGWDSLSNIRFMVAVEQEFGCRLTITQWQQLKNVGDLVNLLTSQ